MEQNGLTRLVGTLSTILLLAISQPGPATGATTIETVFVTGAGPLGYGGYSSIAVDGSGTPHVAFVDEANLVVMYGVRSGGVWTFESVAAQGFDPIFGDPNGIASIALDSSGNPHIAYWDPVPNVLQYASRSGGAWTIETADNVPDNGRVANLEIDSSDNPHIVYYDQTNLHLRYATKSGGIWTTETVDGGDINGYYARIAIDASGNPHVSYSSFTDGTLRYAKKIGGVWTIETVPIGPTSYGQPMPGDIAIDASGNPHIAYIYLLTSPQSLRYARKSGGTWTVEIVDPAARPGASSWPAIRLNPSGNPCVAYYDVGLNRNLKYAERVGGSWITTVIDAPGDVGRRPSMALGAAGNPHITYGNVTNLALKYAAVEISTGFVSGTLLADCPAAGTPLAGVTVDAFAVGSVTLAAAAVTDASGHYTLTVPSAGDYNIVAVVPLGYTAAPPESVIAVAAGQTTTLDFALHCETPSEDVRPVGFWKHQVGIATGGKGSAQVDGETLCGYLDLIAAHFNSNAVNPVVVYVPPASGDCADKLDIASALLNLQGSASMDDRARQQLLALLLNVASGRLGTMTVVSKDGATASQAITYCDNLIDSPTGDYDLARAIAETINNGKVVHAGVIPLSTTQIAYQRGLALRSFRVTAPGGGTRTFSFTMGQSGPVRLNVFDVSGRLVARLVDGELSAGGHSIAWQGVAANGNRVGSGVYLARLETTFGAKTLKVVQIAR